MSYVFVPNSMSVVHFVLVDFGEDVLLLLVFVTGETRSTPGPTWTGLLS